MGGKSTVRIAVHKFLFDILRTTRFTVRNITINDAVNGLCLINQFIIAWILIYASRSTRSMELGMDVSRSDN